MNHPIILPEKRLDILLKKDLKNVQTLDYALNLKEDCFDIRASGCTLEWPLAAAYALAIMTVAGAKKISLVGFDVRDSLIRKGLIINDLGFSVIEPFKDKFPNRTFNAGVSEQNMMGMAAGIASEKCKVWADLFIEENAFLITFSSKSFSNSIINALTKSSRISG